MSSAFRKRQFKLQLRYSISNRYTTAVTVDIFIDNSSEYNMNMCCSDAVVSQDIWSRDYWHDFVYFLNKCVQYPLKLLQLSLKHLDHLTVSGNLKFMISNRHSSLLFQIRDEPNLRNCTALTVQHFNYKVRVCHVFESCIL